MQTADTQVVGNGACETLIGCNDLAKDANLVRCAGVQLGFERSHDGISAVYVPDDLGRSILKLFEE